jgi:hypothetical protein
MRILSFLKPTALKVVALLLGSLLWFLPTWKIATSKISWEQHHGFPFTFIIFDYSGIPGIYPYLYSLEHFDVLALTVDIVVLYFVSCIVAYISHHFTSQQGK